ncbi:MAG: NADPH-dependent FMN reductase [Candidatus Saccharimonadales bacterium]
MKLQIIIGSTRPSRVSHRIAKWVAQQATDLADTAVELIDLQDYNLPLFDEAISPQFNPDRQPNPEAKKWLEKLAEADGYVLVTPEYNRSTPAVLKNALDFVDFQMAKKPVALVGHGSSGGAQAIATLRIALPGLQAVSVPTAAFLLDQIGSKIDGDGEASEDLSAPAQSVKAVLESLAWYASALKVAR